MCLIYHAYWFKALEQPCLLYTLIARASAALTTTQKAYYLAENCLISRCLTSELVIMLELVLPS